MQFNQSKQTISLTKIRPSVIISLKIRRMDTEISNQNDSEWFRQETEKIHTYFITELQRIENEINRRFTVLQNDFDLRQKQIETKSFAQSSNRRIDGSRKFYPRSSLLTDLLKISHFQSLRNVFTAIFLILIIQVTINDLITNGRLHLNFDLLFQAFGNLHIALFIWFLMLLSTAILVYIGFYIWITDRKNLEKSKRHHDMTWLMIYITYIILFLVLPCQQVIKYKLSVASSFIVLLEQLRQLMKTYSFVRENIKKILSVVETENINCPNFSQYLYFLFAPTLIYRDEYPRNRTIRWNFVLKMFGQVLASIFYTYYIIIQFCVPIFENLNQNEITPSIFISVLFKSIFPGSLFLLLGFYSMLHCWLNAFAEMLRFADRMFYKDWWNARSFATFYRTWNIVVYDWLYTYIYSEIYLLIGKRSRAIPAIFVIVLSAIFHEYVLIVALGFFCPVMFLLFGVFGLGFLFVLPKTNNVVYNVILWLSLFTGLGIQACLYFMEGYARKSCPQNDTFWDKLIPRSFVCRVSLAPSKILHIDF